MTPRFAFGWPAKTQALTRPSRGGTAISSALAVTVALALSLFGCDAESPPPWGGAGGASARSLDSAPCVPGSSRSCSVTLGTDGAILSCYHGTQRCEEGAWAPCGNGTTERRSAPRLGSRARALSLSGPRDCADNPCDPSCQVFVEEPEDPIVVYDQQGLVSWRSGSAVDLPPELSAKGFVQPCQTAADCQMNTRCEQPDRGACAHSACVEGQALSDGCNDCASLVCDAHPECCRAPTEPTSCAHDPCRVGAALAGACHPCVARICEDHPSCCSGSGTWSAACVAEVATTCGMQCGCGPNEVAYGGACYFEVTSRRRWSDAVTNCRSRGAGWDLAAVDSANENELLEPYSRDDDVWIGLTDASPYSTSGRWVWSSGSPAGYWRTNDAASTLGYTNWKSRRSSEDGHCARMSEEEDGRWEAEDCSERNRSVCEGPRGHLDATSGPAAWNAACVGYVRSECHAYCDAEAPSLAGGACVPWYPGETDPSCAGVDLSVGVPCAGTIPVCNHGRAEAPAGIELAHFAAGSGQFGSASPDLSHPSRSTCTTSQPIPAGACIEVTSCTGLASGREIMVNPSGAGVAECNRLDNWSLYHDGACGAPSCGGGVSVSGSVSLPVDIVFVIDNSGSMESEISAVQERINKDFAQIIAASGLDYRVIMISRYGDVERDVGDSSHPVCIAAPLGGNACKKPATEKLANNPPHFYHYSANVGSTDAWCLLLASFDKPDEFGDSNRSGWNVKAPRGWSAWLRPDAFKTFVFIGDDDVDCSDWGYAFDDGRSDAGGRAAAAAFDAALLSRSTEQFGIGADRKYVWHSIIGIRESNPASQPWPATAPVNTGVCKSAPGPGTGHQALSILTGGLRYPVCRTQDYSPMFTEIAREVVRSAQSECDLALPSPDVFDVDGAHVGYVRADGTRVTLSEVSGPSACSANGWYYDDRSDPKALHLCPGPCAALRGEAGAHTWLDLDCAGASSSAPLRRTEIYEAECPHGSGALWQFFSYDTEVPSGGSVTFGARTATSEQALEGASFRELAVARRSPDTRVCEVGSGGGCPVDLGALLGGEASRRFLELEIAVRRGPTNQSPAVHDWQLTYSCPDDE